MRHLAAALAAALIITLGAGCVPAAPLLTVMPGQADDYTGNAGCLIEHRGKLLAVRHRFGSKLGLPAGTAEPGESAQQTAHRETWEETGIEVTVGRLLKKSGSAFLYECHPKDPSSLDDITRLAAHDVLEITEVILIDPQSIRPEDWRFPTYLQEVQDIFAALD
ncbi:MAG TPA: NUDIX domain-containing protein [Oligoflexia bacterium]|nr:NUDIX domain-containing protein [Oligoflexia bacterium]